MHGGELIFQTSDQFGAIQVIDYQQQLRCLHFNNSTQQSAMLLSHPTVLIHRYTQGMMLPLIWRPASRVLLLGLGAGAIARYLFQYFPECKVEAVELRNAVIEIASEFFLLPEDETRLKIHNADALEWIAHKADKNTYELIFVDMFLTTNHGTDQSADIVESLNNLVKLLDENGIIVFNHLGKESHSFKALNPLIQRTDGFYLYEVNIDEANTIIYASRHPCPGKLADEMFYEFEKQRSSPFKQYHDRLRRLDSSL